MAISDKDRKRLWAHSGNRCALCKTRLVAESTAQDPEAVVGDEAHISARSPGGPRYGTSAPNEVDTYDNLILLCRTDHKKVDDQPGHFTPERLHALKRDHHAWVESRLTASDDEIVIEYDEPPPPLILLRTGTAVWDVIANNHDYNLADLDEEGATEEDLERASGFLQLARDWADISSDVIDQGPAAVRHAKNGLAEELKELAAHDLLVFGGRRHGQIRGGIGPPKVWREMYLTVVRSDDPTISRATDPTKPDETRPSTARDQEAPPQPTRSDAILGDLLRALARTPAGARVPTHPETPWIVGDHEVTPQERNEATTRGRDLGLLHAINMHDGFWFAAALLAPGRECVNDYDGNIQAWRSRGQTR